METADTDRLPEHAHGGRSGPTICELNCLYVLQEVKTFWSDS